MVAGGGEAGRRLTESVHRDIGLDRTEGLVITLYIFLPTYIVLLHLTLIDPHTY